LTPKTVGEVVYSLRRRHEHEESRRSKPDITNCGLRPTLSFGLCYRCGAILIAVGSSSRGIFVWCHPLTFHQLETPSLEREDSKKVPMQFQIDNMACGGCATSVTKAIQSLDPQAKVDIDLTAKRVNVESAADESAVVAVLENVGYPPRRAA